MPTLHHIILSFELLGLETLEALYNSIYKDLILSGPLLGFSKPTFCKCSSIYI